jgi:hypothetical protein
MVSASHEELRLSVGFDRRQVKRYSLRGPVVFSWEDAQGRLRKEGGVTRDFNRNGEFIVGDACPQLGAKIRMAIRLPHIPLGDRLLQIHARGTVIRIEEKPGLENGFAVLNETCKLYFEDLGE